MGEVRGKCSTREHLISCESWQSFVRTAWAEEILENGRHAVTPITFVDISIFLLISWPIPSDTPFNSTNRFCGHGFVGSCTAILLHDPFRSGGLCRSDYCTTAIRFWHSLSIKRPSSVPRQSHPPSPGWGLLSRNFKKAFKPAYSRLFEILQGVSFQCFPLILHLQLGYNSKRIWIAQLFFALLTAVNNHMQVNNLLIFWTSLPTLQTSTLLRWKPSVCVGLNKVKHGSNTFHPCFSSWIHLVHDWDFKTFLTCKRNVPGFAVNRKSSQYPKSSWTMQILSL